MACLIFKPIEVIINVMEVYFFLKKNICYNTSYNYLKSVTSLDIKC